MAYGSSRGMARASGSWLLVVGAVAVILFLSIRALAPPAPLGDEAPADRFAEGRARAVVRHLTETIGLRANGTPGHARAAAYLADELRRIPGVAVEVQSASRTHVHQRFPSLPFVFETTNVIGRLPGRTTEAILLDAHFDTLIDSVGAADDAAGVAAIVETLRVLAREAPLERTILVNLNGAEEIGLLGAAAFLAHPLAQTVRAYVYLEALPGGKALLLGAGPGRPDLAKAYARVAPSPLGNVLAQDLAQSGLLPFNGDFTPLHEAGLSGLDVAMVGDAWAVHTRLDRRERLAPGGLQHMGETTLAVTRALAAGDLASSATGEPAVYFDLLGFRMVAYSSTTARALGALALVAFLLLVWRALHFHWLSWRNLLGAWVWNCLAGVAGVSASLLVALAMKVLPHGGLGWLGHPALVLACFASPAAAAMLLVHGRWRRRALRTMVGDERRVELSTWLAGQVLWAGWLLLATLAGVGAGYQPLAWVAGGAVGLVVCTAVPRARGAGLVLTLVPGAVVTIEAAVQVVASLVPMAGLVPATVPTDVVIALLVGVATALVGMVACTLPCRDGGFGKAAVVCAVAGLGGIVLAAVVPPYSAARPKRVLVAHAAVDERSALLLAATGPDGMRPLAGVLGDARPADAGWPSLDVFLPPFSHVLPAPPPALSAPTATVTTESYDAPTDVRRVTVHLAGDGPQLRLLLPQDRLTGWSITPDFGKAVPIDGRYVVHFEGVPATGMDVQLELRGWQPVEAELRVVGGAPAAADAVTALRQRLPDWANLTAYDFRAAKIKI